MNTYKWLQTIKKWIEFRICTRQWVLTHNRLPQKSAVQSIHPQHRCSFYTKQNHTRKYSTTTLKENSQQDLRDHGGNSELRQESHRTENTEEYGGGELMGREGREESSAVRSFAEFCFRKSLRSITYLLEIGIGRHVGNVILQWLLARTVALLQLCFQCSLHFWQT